MCLFFSVYVEYSDFWSLNIPFHAGLPLTFTKNLQHWEWHQLLNVVLRSLNNFLLNHVTKSIPLKCV